MTPYTPKSLNPKVQERINAFYASLGITQEILLEDGWYVWAFYRHGERLPGGINDLTDVIKASNDA